MNRCYCIGCGASLRGFDFSRLNGYHTIGTNFIIEDYPEAEYSVFLDSYFFNKKEKAIKDYTGKVVCHLRAVPDNYRGENIRIIETSLNNINEDSLDKGWLLGRLSGLTALNLAIVLGFNPIYLLGYDMHGTNYNDNIPVPFADDNNCMELFRKFTSLKKQVEIINLNPDSKIPFFRKNADHFRVQL